MDNEICGPTYLDYIYTQNGSLAWTAGAYNLKSISAWRVNWSGHGRLTKRLVKSVVVKFLVSGE